jgi:phosphatidylinositol alpha-1,6-mannosyltransferase
MKICFFTQELSSHNGWGRYSISLIDQMLKKGIDCQVLVSVNAQVNELPQIKIKKVLPPLFTKRAIKFFYLIKNYWQIRRLIQTSDMVHSLVEPYGPIAYLIARNKPLIITLHGTYAIDALRKWYLRSLYSRVYKKARRIICVSRFTQQAFLEKVQLNNTVAINNGIDYEKFQIDESFQVSSENSKNIIGVGALMFRKGYHISIPAIGEVVKKYPDLKYYIIGNQENQGYFKQLQDLAKKHQLKDNLVFLEKISDEHLIRLYHQADLFLLTPVNINSSFEGFGLVYLEANACGKPVIGTYNCGAEEAIKDGYNGLLIEQDNIEETSQAILKILDNPVLAEKLGQNGQKWAQEHDWSKVILKYLKIYDQIINHHSNL